MDIWDWELLGNPSEHRLEQWGEQYRLRYGKLYGIFLTEQDLEERHCHLLENPLFLAIAQFQEFWLYWVWVIRYRLFRCWYQDLNDDRRHWIHGRGRVYLLMNDQRAIDSYHCIKLYASWCVPRLSFGIEVSVGGEDNGVTLNIGCLLFSLWLGIEHIIPRFWQSKISKYDHERVTGIRIHHSTLWLAIWRDEYGYADWKGFHWSLNLPDLLFGDAKFTEEFLSEQTTDICFPEGAYPAKLKLVIHSWKRPRLPFTKAVRRCEIDLERPVPVPGKGENSHDQEQDAVYSTSLQAMSFEEAISKFIAGIEETRIKYGGEGWLPSEL